MHGSTRLARISGCLSAILLIAGIATLGELIGSVGDSDATFVEYFAEPGNRARDITGGVLILLAAVAFLIFINETMPSTGDGGLSSGRTSWALGLILATLLIIAAAAASATSVSRIYSEAFDEGAGLSEGNAAAVLPQLATVLLMSAAAVAAAWTIAISINGLQTALLPRLVCYLGFGAAALLVLSLGGLPLVPFPFWLLLAALTIRGEQAPPVLRVSARETTG